MLDRAAVDALFPPDLPEPDHWERRYPPRELPAGAHVTRFGPSPTGSLHIGGVYAAMICKDVAAHSGGVFFARIEDTDQAREIEGVSEQFARSFTHFRIEPDESDAVGGAYGPYRQSQREQIYLTYARELMRHGRAYPCFATKDELAEATRRQQQLKAPTGYYGTWATWRDADPDEVRARLDAGEPYVVRFRTPDWVEGARSRYDDVIRGVVEAEDNRNDAVLLKSSAQSPRLPTYHFAHAVDEHLMRVDLVIRGEEWVSSVPLHRQLFAALGFDEPRYAHIAPLMKQDGGSKRKLSKRRDPEASVDFYVDEGWPVDAVAYYLRGLANGRLAELPIAQSLAEPIRLSECGVAGPLVDMVKLADISGDVIAAMSGSDVLAAVAEWARDRDPELVAVIEADRDLALRAVDVERVGVDNPRKDLVKWSDFRAVYGFFFPALFEPVADQGDPRLGGVHPAIVRALAADFADGYVESDDQPTWFAQIRDLAAKHGFAPSPKAYKADPAAFPGMLRDAANIIRVALTGSSRSPDLHAVASALGRDEVVRRVRALA